MLETLKEKFAGRSWTPVTLGFSGARVWRIEGVRPLFVKTTEHAVYRDDGADLAAEAERLQWLAGQGIPVSDVIDAGADDRFAWLVTAAVPGRTAADPWPEQRREAVVDAIAAMTARLHALPVDGCPFDRRLAVSVPEAIELAGTGRVDLDDLDAVRAGWSAQRLSDELVRTRPADEDTVVCHGDLCLPNVLLDPVTIEVTGLIDVGRAGLADRHTDVALMTRSLSNTLNEQFGSGYADRFVARYAGLTGADITPERIEFYRLLDEFA